MLSSSHRLSPCSLDSCRLVGGLASENVRWAESVENFRCQGVTLCGDVLLISAFVSYVGYFTKKYRNELMEKFWIPYINKLKVRSTVVVMTQGDSGAPPGQPQPYCILTGAQPASFTGIDITSGMPQGCFYKQCEGRLLHGLALQSMWPVPTSEHGEKVSRAETAQSVVFVAETWRPEPRSLTPIF